MMESIYPQLKIGDQFILLEKGLTRTEVRALIARDVETFVKSPSYSTIPTDDVKNIGLHLYYQDKDTLIGFEVFRYQNQADVVINGISLLHTNWSLLGKQLDEEKIPYIINNDGYGITIGNDLVRLYIPDIEEIEEYPVMVDSAYVRLDDDQSMHECEQ